VVGGILVISVAFAWPGGIPDQQAVLKSIAFGPKQGVSDAVTLTLAGTLSGRTDRLTEAPRCRINQFGPYGAIGYSTAIDTVVRGHQLELRISIDDFPGSPATVAVSPNQPGQVTLEDSTGVISYGDDNLQQTAPLGLAHGSVWIGDAGHTGRIDAFLLGVSGAGQAGSVTVVGTWSCTYLSL
jgi:hypothetical protein